ncbi:hypothetical protein GPECTOR_164g148 [Gonium pectorale]|uniref:Uncharacterized protein n=1 Tax=Gonium pectorale TaxID=33097 RepID=A0A150FXH7_GONPE|nr:hypothetical protein GPECTOR_164g148 [Gonium pectorale]|eukprot:KXZ42306.1 hypothetical protein GPECTOR_164g148 [Gonium pectorale]
MDDPEELTRAIMELVPSVSVRLRDERVSLQDLLEEDTWTREVDQQEAKRLLADNLKVGEQLELMLRRVVVSHAWPLLRRGLVLLDLPGVADAQRSRGNIATQAVSKADSVMVVATIARFLANPTAQEYARAVVEGGAPDTMGVEAQLRTDMHFAHIFVPTCADDVPRGVGPPLAAYKRQEDAAFFGPAGVDRAQYLELCTAADQGTPTPIQRMRLRHMYARLRQAKVKQQALEVVQAAMGRQNRVISAHTVSAVEYLSMNFPDMYDPPVIFKDERETGLVDLQQQLERLPDQHKMVRVRAVAGALLDLIPMVVDALMGECDRASILSPNLPTNTTAEDLKCNLNSTHHALVTSLDSLLRSITSSIGNLEGAFPQAQALLQRRLGSLHHKTLMMLCSNGGRSTARSTTLRNYNLNQELAQPFIDPIQAVWVQTFGLGGTLFTDVVEPWYRQLLAAFNSAVDELQAGQAGQQLGMWQQARNSMQARGTAAMEELRELCNLLTRQIVPAVVNAIEGGLGPAYEQNRRDYGRHVQVRMQGRLQTAFADRAMLDNIRSTLTGRLDRLDTGIKRLAQALLDFAMHQFALTLGGSPVAGAHRRRDARQGATAWAVGAVSRVQELLAQLEAGS